MHGNTAARTRCARVWAETHTRCVFGIPKRFLRTHTSLRVRWRLCVHGDVGPSADPKDRRERRLYDKPDLYYDEEEYYDDDFYYDDDYDLYDDYDDEIFFDEYDPPLDNGEGNQVRANDLNELNDDDLIHNNVIHKDDNIHSKDTLGKAEQKTKFKVKGNPGVDFPAFKFLPETRFRCEGRALGTTPISRRAARRGHRSKTLVHSASPGDSDGVGRGGRSGKHFLGESVTISHDTESSSLSQYLPPFQVFHVCEPGNAQHDFLCPEGTIFNQKYIVCDWWYNVDCPKSPDFFELNLEFFKEGEVTSPPLTAVPGPKGAVARLAARPQQGSRRPQRRRPQGQRRQQVAVTEVPLQAAGTMRTPQASVYVPPLPPTLQQVSIAAERQVSPAVTSVAGLSYEAPPRNAALSQALRIAEDSVAPEGGARAEAGRPAKVWRWSIPRKVNRLPFAAAAASLRALRTTSGRPHRAHPQPRGPGPAGAEPERPNPPAHPPRIVGRGGRRRPRACARPAACAPQASPDLPSDPEPLPPSPAPRTVTGRRLAASRRPRRTPPPPSPRRLPHTPIPWQQPTHNPCPTPCPHHTRSPIPPMPLLPLRLPRGPSAPALRRARRPPALGLLVKPKSLSGHEALPALAPRPSSTRPPRPPPPIRTSALRQHLPHALSYPGSLPDTRADTPRPPRRRRPRPHRPRTPPPRPRPPTPRPHPSPVPGGRPPLGHAHLPSHHAGVPPDDAQDPTSGGEVHVVGALRDRPAPPPVVPEAAALPLAHVTRLARPAPAPPPPAPHDASSAAPPPSRPPCFPSPSSVARARGLRVNNSKAKL
nr:nascent polypeptide-associated complex subunit alpha, muscle-specific form-like [Penaeus vannamei]